MGTLRVFEPERDFLRCEQLQVAQLQVAQSQKYVGHSTDRTVLDIIAIISDDTPEKTRLASTLEQLSQVEIEAVASMATNPKPMKRDMRFSLLAMEMTLAWTAKRVPGATAFSWGNRPPSQRCG